MPDALIATRRRRRSARAWAVVGLSLGLLSVIAGARVLAGVDRPDYVVLPWLVVYNVLGGAAGAVAAGGVLALRRWGRAGAGLLAGAHGTVLLALLGMRLFGGAVATDSLGAMALRTTVWLAIAVAASRAIASTSALAPRA